MRPMTLLLCLALAGCAGADAAHSSFAPEPAAAASGAVAQNEVADPPLLPGPAGQPSPRKPKGKGKKSDAKSGAKPDDSAQEEWWKEGGITREKINAMCWMKYEKGAKDLPLDKRADLVDVCVKETLKEHPLN